LVARALVVSAFGLIAAVGPQQQGARKLLVAHRGASAYAPEHTVEAYRLAIEQRADFVEQDLAVTKDGVLVCIHDLTLDRTTDAEEVFPDRFSEDRSGTTPVRRWLVHDFTLAEIKRLDAGSWFDSRFAAERVPTWNEAVAAIGTSAGLYPELKTPDLYGARGIDQVRMFVESMQRPPLAERLRGSVIVQSFDDRALRDLAAMLPAVPRTFLIEVRDGPRWLSRHGLAEVATFATGIGPEKALLNDHSEIVEWAHEAGLSVIPYTFSTLGPSTRFPDVTDEMRHYLTTLGVDALFTDNPDRFPRDADSR
jgi:glycerophosphoryl diester phosphodiesterase